MSVCVSVPACVCACVCVCVCARASLCVHVDHRRNLCIAALLALPKFEATLTRKLHRRSACTLQRNAVSFDSLLYERDRLRERGVTCETHGLRGVIDTLTPVAHFSCSLHRPALSFTLPLTVSVCPRLTAG